MLLLARGAQVVICLPLCLSKDMNTIQNVLYRCFSSVLHSRYLPIQWQRLFLDIAN